MKATINLGAYFRRIGHAGRAAPDLETLKALHLRHPRSIAFENLDPLTGRPVRLDAATFEHKLVRTGRGGYCFEHNMLFRHVLAGLGFAVQSLIGRTLWRQPPGRQTARGHMALKVDVDGEAYLADVGFGGLTLTAPLRLQGGPVQETPHGRFRLAAEPCGYRLEAEVAGAWQALYRFDLEPPAELDIAFANHYLSSHPDSPYVRELFAARTEGETRLALHNNRLSVHHADGTTTRELLDSPEALSEALRTRFELHLPVGPALDAALARIVGPAAADLPDAIALRPAVPADDAACGRIISAATLAAPTAARLPHAQALFEDASPLPAKGGARLVATDPEAQVMGFADFDAGRAYVHYLFVAPEAQRRGVGGALLDAAQAACGERAISLSCWAVNDRAFDWYLRRGFAVTGGGFKALAGRPVAHLVLSRPGRPVG